jgi:hypothetical protein
MNVGLSESATIAVLLLLIFGAVSFYLYSRVNYTEKRMSLMENMLLDIKMGIESMGTKEEPEYAPEPVGMPTPMESTEAEVLPEEETYYKTVQDDEEDKRETVVPPAATEKPVSVTPNYESMSKDDLIALAEKRGIKLGKRPGRKDLIASLRKGEEVSGAVTNSDLFPMAETLEDDGGNIASENLE